MAYAYCCVARVAQQLVKNPLLLGWCLYELHVKGGARRRDDGWPSSSCRLLLLLGRRWGGAGACGSGQMMLRRLDGVDGGPEGGVVLEG